MKAHEWLDYEADERRQRAQRLLHDLSSLARGVAADIDTCGGEGAWGQMAWMADHSQGLAYQAVEIERLLSAALALHQASRQIKPLDDDNSA